MRLLYEMFGLREAGVPNKPTAEPKKRRKPFATDRDDDDEDDVPEFGTSDVPEDEPVPEFGASEDEPQDDEGDPVEDEPEPDPEDELDPRNDRKFASEPQRPKAQPAPTGLSISGDPGTLSQLRDALEQLSNTPRVDQDLADWLDECVRAIDMAGRRHEPTVNLPKFAATPDLDDFDDAGSDDDYED